jgi:alkylation response protein AidB-like acyl-CoA dehydrogenase
MNFELTTDQKLLVETVRGFVQRESPPDRLRKLREDNIGWSKDLWRKMGDLGWLALPFPEQFGGLGQSFVEVALVLEQLGTSVVPEPYLPSIVLAGMLLADVGTDAQREEWLPRVAAGEAVLACAYAERNSRFDPGNVETRATREGGEYVLTGEKRFVLAGNAADAFLVTANTGNGISLFLVPRTAAKLAVVSLRTTDGQRAAHLRLNGVRIPEAARCGAEGTALPHVVRALDRAAAGACAEAVGVMTTALRMTVEYLGTRQQFGVKIGTFQVLQHRAVDMFIESELAKSMALVAAMRADSSDEAERARAISAAKAHVAASGRFVTAQSIQLHGGIGISDEHDIGLYFKRMHALATLFGDEEFHVERYAKLQSA